VLRKLYKLRPVLIDDIITESDLIQFRQERLDITPSIKRRSDSIRYLLQLDGGEAGDITERELGRNTLPRYPIGGLFRRADGLELLLTNLPQLGDLRRLIVLLFPKRFKIGDSFLLGLKALLPSGLPLLFSVLDVISERDLSSIAAPRLEDRPETVRASGIVRFRGLVGSAEKTETGNLRDFLLTFAA
jgi:hypothetical protein